MSQVNFRGTTKDGIPIEVQGGWDPPLEYYHFTIFDVSNEDEEEILYSCLDEDIEMFQSNEHHKATLARFGVEAPEGFWERCDRKLGNVCFGIKDGKWAPY